MKLQVGICDDEILILDKLKDIVSSCLEEMGVDYDLMCFESAETLVEKAEGLDIVFLDIAMPQMDGIAAGKQIQLINKECKIIIASAMIERFKETYQICAFRFITKPYEKEEVQEALKAIVQRGVGVEYIEVYRDRKKYTIRQKKIKYMVAYDGYVEVKAGQYLFRKETSLNEMEKCLDEKIFARIHKQYLINMLWIDEYSDNSVQIEEKEFKISRRKSLEFNKKYMNFDINYR
ncbi:MAG: response regulator transcription factor [Lachnospiraceae bacterium]|nr:response regulator transcription factor [Lachnospiraceae bacterium]